jgi:hypothetical protein
VYAILERQFDRLFNPVRFVDGEDHFEKTAAVGGRLQRVFAPVIPIIDIAGLLGFRFVVLDGVRHSEPERDRVVS